MISERTELQSVDKQPVQLPVKSGVRQITIMERASLKSSESMMRNFPNATVALLELVDNGVDNQMKDRNGVGIRPVAIDIKISRDRIHITNEGGSGLDEKGLEDFLNWGHSEKTEKEIGKYGVGGKAAMGFLGKSIKVICSPDGSNEAIHFEDKSWDQKEEVAVRPHSATVREAVKQEGYFHLIIEGVEKKFKNIDELKKRLGSVYRLRLIAGDITINLNGHKVAPLDIESQLRTDEALEPQVYDVKSRVGDVIKIWFGALVDKHNPDIKPGLRLTYNRRLIKEGEFLGLPRPEQMPQARFLIGEVDIKVKESVTMNKSSFIEEGMNWEAAKRAIEQNVKPFYDRLKNIEVESGNAIDETDKDVLDKAKKALDEVMRGMEELARDEFKVTRRLGPPGSGGSGGGGKEGNKGGKKGKEGHNNDGETVRRFGAFDEFRCLSLGDEGSKTALLKQADGKQILVVNVDFPQYQASKKQGVISLEMYVADVAAFEVCKILCEGNFDEFEKKYISLTKSLGKFYQEVHNRGHEKVARRASSTRGTISNFNKK